MRVLLALSIGVAAGLMLANGALGGAFPALPLERLASWLPLGLRGTAMVAFGLTMSVLVLLTLVSEGGFRKGEISTVVPSFFAFYAFFFGMTYWLFALSTHRPPRGPVHGYWKPWLYPSESAGASVHRLQTSSIASS